MTDTGAGAGTGEQFDDLIPPWLFRIQGPSGRALAAVLATIVVCIPLALVADSTDYRFGPFMVVGVIAAGAVAGWPAATAAGVAILLAYWYEAVPPSSSFVLDDSANVVAVAGMAIICLGLPVIARRLERSVRDVRRLDAARLLALGEQAELRRRAEDTTEQVRGALLIATAVAESRTRAEVASRVLALLALPDVISAGSIAVVQGHHLHVLASVGADPATIAALEAADLRSSAWLQSVLGGGMALVDDRARFAAEHPDEAVLGLYRSGSWAAIPFRAGEDIGLLSIHYVVPQSLTACQLHFELVAEVLASSLERTAAEERDEQRRVELQEAFAERDRIARTLATALLPSALPRLPGFTAAAWSIPGTTDQVAGDFYDVFPVDDGWVAVLGDVCGKGVEAAAVTSLARYAIRVAALSDPDPVRIAVLANEALLADASQLFCTAAVVRYHRSSGELEVALAGHPQVRVLSAGGVRGVGRYGMALGLATRPPEPERIALQPGDVVLIYSDGLVERRRDYDDESLDADLAGWRGLTAEAVATAIRDRVEATDADREDDVAVLVIGRTA